MEHKTPHPFEELSHNGDETHLLREIVRTHQVLMAGFSRKVGMPASRFALMRLVALAEPDIGIMDLARELGINAAAVTRQINEMEASDFIQRHTDPNDGRRTQVRLTPKGLLRFKEIHARSHELERALSTALVAEDIATTVKVLTTLRNFIETYNKGKVI
jgi:DNA-binding MarR family transcriptional regulator